MDQSQQTHFQMHARVGLAAEIVVSLQQNVEKSREVFFAEERGRFCKRGTLIGSSSNQIGIRAANASNQEIAYVANCFTAEMLQVAAFFLKGVYKTERAVRGPSSNSFHQFVQRVFGNNTEKFAHFFVGNIFAAISASLFEQG